MFAPIRSQNIWNTPVDPVKWSPAKSGCSRRKSVISAELPGMKLMTPAGRPASTRTFMTYQLLRIAV